MQQLKKQGLRYHFKRYHLVLSAFVLCLLLSACDPFPKSPSPAASAPKAVLPTTVPTMAPTPTMSAALTSQGTKQLQIFQQWIGLLKQNSGDATTYQQQYDADQQALQNATTDDAYQAALATLNVHIEAMKLPTMKVQAHRLQQDLQQQVASWGQQHTYYNTYDKTNYTLGYEYGPYGISGWAQDELDRARTQADYQQVIDNLQMYQTNFQAMTINKSDKTSYNQPHQTDLQLMQHYGEAGGKVIVVSLQEQAMRVYDNGQLVKAFLVTTGRPTHPSLPGSWWVEKMKKDDTFRSGVKPGQPGYYPDTHINYDLLYHSGEYYIHDSWWRKDYGPNTNFPHIDSSHDPFSYEGSHGCVNMRTLDVAWVYGFAQMNTSIIIY